MERNLDFWLGSWTCTWDGGHGTNRVSRELGDHVIVERFEALAPEPFAGLSVSVFDADAGWRQTWVDANGSYWHFVGEAGDGTFTFGTPERVDADRVYKRMVFSELERDRFHWRWESSADGELWTERWAIEYRRGSSAPPD